MAIVKKAADEFSAPTQKTGTKRPPSSRKAKVEHKRARKLAKQQAAECGTNTVPQPAGKKKRLSTLEEICLFNISNG